MIKAKRIAVAGAYIMAIGCTFLDRWNLFGIAIAYILYEIFVVVADIKEDLRDE